MGFLNSLKLIKDKVNSLNYWSKAIVYGLFFGILIGLIAFLIIVISHADHNEVKFWWAFVVGGIAFGVIFLYVLIRSFFDKVDDEPLTKDEQKELTHFGYKSKKGNKK